MTGQVNMSQHCTQNWWLYRGKQSFQEGDGSPTLTAFLLSLLSNWVRLSCDQSYLANLVLSLALYHSKHCPQAQKHPIPMLISMEALRVLSQKVFLPSLMSLPYTAHIVNKACELLGHEKLQGIAGNARHSVDLNAKNEETDLSVEKMFLSLLVPQSFRPK